MKLALIYGESDNIALMTFNLLEFNGHWRPTTFSSGGYPAFCASDHKDGLGRTMPLRGGKSGLREFVIGDDGPIELHECSPLGCAGIDMISLVDFDRIIAELMKRAH